MLIQILYLAVAQYYKKQNQRIGLTILLERWPIDKLPEDFLFWWKQNQNFITDRCYSYAENEIHFTYPGCWDYPEAFLKNIDPVPLLISYLGHPHWNQNLNLAVVGSRKMSPLTQEWFNHQLLPLLNRKSINVVSGGARGVDQAAHLCALRAKKPTFVFLPSGINKIYPSDLGEWKDEVIGSGGAFISEYAPDEELKKYYFIERNRLIAAIANFILVAQGELRSGTMLTAKWALDLGRDIGAIPGHPMDPSYSGNLSLIRAGVPSVIDRQDLEDLIDWNK
jgi:DNA processing protein